MILVRPIYLYLGGLLLLLAGGTAGWYYWQYRQARESVFDDLADIEDEVTFDPPDVRGSIIDIFRVMRHHQTAKKLAARGYVKWYKLGSTLSKPRWVKPKREGAGTPKFEDDDQPYYFPKEAMVSDQQTGAWVAFHREGEADPINLRDPAYPGIETDLIEKIINLEAENEPRSSLFGLDISMRMAVIGITAVLFVIYAAARMYGG